MNFKYWFILSTLIYSILSCNQKKEVSFNDGATKFVKMVLEKAYFDKVIDRDTFINKNTFNDSILFENNEILTSFYSEPESFKIKRMTKKQICDYVYTLTDSNKISGLNVWQLYSIVKTDTSFDISLERVALIKNFNSDGSPIMTPRGLYDGNERCNFKWRDKSAEYRVTIRNGKYVVKLVNFSWGDNP